MEFYPAEQKDGRRLPGANQNSRHTHEPDERQF
jgi:hypothetical protein